MSKKLLIKLLLILLLISVNLYFLPSKGTGDVDNWLNIINSLISSHPVAFLQSCLKYDCPVFYPLTYPPGHLLLVYAIAQIFPSYIFGPLFSFKLSVFLFYLLGLFTLGIFYFSMQKINKKFKPLDVILLYLSSLSIILNTQVLGYTDIYYLPFLFLSLYFLFRAEFFISGAFFSVSFLIKWQPLILLPLIVFYLLSKIKNPKKLANFAFGLAMPILLLALLNPDIISSLKLSLFGGAVSNIFLSAGLNLSWLLGEFLGKFTPIPVAEFSSGYNYIIIKEFYSYRFLLIIPKIIFVLAYLILLLKFHQDLNKFKRNNIFLFFKYAVLVFLSYFVISSGVHENHLITALFFGIPLFLFYPSKLHFRLLVYLEIYNFSSMFVFYGISGNTLIPNGLLGINWAIWGSLIFSCLYFYFWAMLINEDPNGKSV